MRHERSLNRIKNSFVPKIPWTEDKPNFLLSQQEVHVWKVSVAENFHRLFRSNRWILEPQEFRKAKAFHWEKDVKRYLTGRIVLKLLLSKYSLVSPTEVRFISCEGKPRLVPALPLKFNLSYDVSSILLSFGVCETGIDVEFIKPDFEFKEMLSSCFSSDEVAYILGDEARSREEFFLQWTRKEALLKYTGQGIIDDLSAVPSLYGTHKPTKNQFEINADITVESFRTSTTSVASVAYPSTISSVRYFEWK